MGSFSRSCSFKLRRGGLTGRAGYRRRYSLSASGHALLLMGLLCIALALVAFPASLQADAGGEQEPVGETMETPEPVPGITITIQPWVLICIPVFALILLTGLLAKSFLFQGEGQSEEPAEDGDDELDEDEEDENVDAS